MGLLKAKLAKYRSELLEPSKKGEKGEGFDVLKSGDARVALIGFPSVGKSTLLSTLTKTESEAANYEFTTLTCIPGVIDYRGANIQLLDLPVSFAPIKFWPNETQKFHSTCLIFLHRVLSRVLPKAKVEDVK